MTKKTVQTDIATLSELLDALLEKGGDPAIVQFDSDDRLCSSREELAGHISALAGGLLEIGVKQGSTVAVCGNVSISWITVALGAVGAGAVLVPIDAQMDDDNLEHVLRDCAPACIFTDTEHRQRISELELENRPDIYLLEDANDESNWRHLRTESPPELPRSDPKDEAVLFYTSGTTGFPKGVPLTHANLVYQIHAVHAAGIARDSDRVMLPLPLHHIYPFAIGMLVPLAVGATVVVPQALTGPQLIRAIREGECTVIIGIPRLYRALYEGVQNRFAGRGRLARLYFRAAVATGMFLKSTFGLLAGRWLLRPLHRQMGGCLRLMACGGAPLDPDLGQRLEGMGFPIAIGYGLTETSPLLTVRSSTGSPLNSVGKPVEGTELRIDRSIEKQGEDRKSVAGEDEGEILARGPGVFHGYRNLPDDSSRAFSDSAGKDAGPCRSGCDRRSLRGLARSSPLAASRRNIGGFRCAGGC